MKLIFRDRRVASFIQLTQRVFGGYKRQLIVLTLLGTVGGFLEGIGVNALIPLFSFAIGNGATVDDPISRMLKSSFGFFHIHFNVPYLLIFISLLFVTKALITIYLDYVKLKITHDYEEKMRNRLFRSIVYANWPHHIKQKIGYLEAILMIDIPAGATLMKHISGAIIIFTSLIIYIVIALNISYVITLITLLVGAFSFLIIKPLIFEVKTLGQELSKVAKQSGHHVSENILGMKTVKSMAVKLGVVKKGSEFFRRHKDIEIRQNIIKTVASSFIQPVGIIFICILFAFTYKSPSFNLAALVAIVYLIHKIFTYIQQLQRTLQGVNSLVPHLVAALDYEEKANQNLELSEGTKTFSFRHQLEFKDIAFSYIEGKKVFHNINFTVKKGQMVGFIGPSGAGKTTLVDIILRLLKPTSGAIFLDGVSIDTIDLEEWRKSLGYVSQDIFLMNDTIANNIRFYNNEISEKDIIDAARMAQIYDFVQNTPKGFDTVIGDRGIFLSAGQRQRVVIARVLARKPQLLILDEATSALDNESEVKIREVIKHLKGEITVIVIAHRLSTIFDSDILIALEDGKIVEQGDPQELLRDKGSYFFKVFNVRRDSYEHITR